MDTRTDCILTQVYKSSQAIDLMIHTAHTKPPSTIIHKDVLCTLDTKLCSSHHELRQSRIASQLFYAQRHIFTNRQEQLKMQVTSV